VNTSSLQCNSLLMWTFAVCTGPPLHADQPFPPSLLSSKPHIQLLTFTKHAPLKITRRMHGVSLSKLGSHCKYTTYTTQNEHMGLRVQSYQSTHTHTHNTGTDSTGCCRHTWCYIVYTLIQPIMCSAGQRTVCVDS